MRVEVNDVPSIQIGQAVRVTLPANSQWRAILFVFAIPIVSFFAGGALLGVPGWAGWVKGPAAVILMAAGAFAGAGAALVAARGADRRFRRRIMETARIEPLDK